VEIFDGIRGADLVAVTPGRNVGVLLVRFRFKPYSGRGTQGSDLSARPEIEGEPEVIPLDRAVYARRFKLVDSGVVGPKVEAKESRKGEKRKGAKRSR
jgi:hypothetical protein